MNSGPISPPQQERFCQEYIIDLNRTKAAKRAKYSKRSAHAQGCRLLKVAKVKKRIAELMKEREERTGVTQDRVLKELALIGFSDIADLLEIEEGGLIMIKRFEEMPEGKSRLIKSIKEDRIIKEGADGKQLIIHDKIRYEVWDKTKALEMMGKHLGMFHELGDTLAEVIYEISERFMPRTQKDNPGNPQKEKPANRQIQMKDK